MPEKTMPLHPDPSKQGVNIEKAKYDAVRAAILAAVEEAGETTFKSLMAEMADRLSEFRGSIGWYTTIVKMDLEARGLIESIPDKKPQPIRLKN